MHKKVITWEQLFRLCKNRRLSRFCGIMPEDETDKECKWNNDTKARCPIWNGQFENLAMLRPNNESYQSRSDHGEKRHTKSFRDEERHP